MTTLQGCPAPIVYDFDPNNLPDRYLRAIGLMVAASSQTESIQQQFIGALLGIDQLETIALTAHMTGPLKDHVIRALAELNGPTQSEVDAIDNLLDKVSDASATRNAVVHNSFAMHPDTGEVLSLRATARGSLQVSLTPIAVEQIEKDAAAIYEVGLDVMRFMISRNLGQANRTRDVHAPMDRRKKARERRRNLVVRKEGG